MLPKNNVMDQIEKLDQLLRIVGLLRAQFSSIMKIIYEHRESYKSQFQYPPEEVRQLMSKSQGLFAELLKAGDFLRTSKENTKDFFDNYLQKWIVSQTRERMEGIENFIVTLNQQTIQGLIFDPKVLERSSGLVTEAIRILK